MGLFKKVVDTIIPPRCVVTGDVVDQDGALSSTAWAQLNFINDPYCEICGIPFDLDAGDKTQCVDCLSDRPVYHRHRSCVSYDDVSRKMILKFKHGDHINISRSFTPWLARSGQEFWEGCDYLIPVPLHYWRLVYRRYNQAAILSSLLSKELNIEWLPQTLVRRRATVVQGHMNAADRRRNVRNAFEVEEKQSSKLKGKTVVLVDDVYTTGSTVNECAEALLDGGVEKVNVLTVSRVVR